MRVELLLLFLVVEVGIYLMRLLPLLPWSLRREAGGAPGAEEPGGLLPLVGSSVVAALLVTSVLPEASGPGYGVELTRNTVALVPTFVVAHRFGNLGLTGLLGVLAYGLVSWVT